MIALLDTSHDLTVCERELGCPVGQLLTPLTGFRLQDPDKPFGIDNGSFKRFLKDRFLSLLARENERRHLCKFVAVPDVPFSARRTMEVFSYWFDRLEGWPLALVAQDGHEDIDIPWDLIKAIFIGGSDTWKDGRHAEGIIKAAKAMDVYTHVGRVNGVGRFLKFERLGVDSIDGSGIAQYSEMRLKIKSAREGDPQSMLFSEEAA
jgi:hypothetical protein